MRPHDLDPDLLPWSQQSEAAVLGALLQDNGVWDQVGDLIARRHFFDPNHGLIFDTIGALVLATKPADVITVFERLRELGKDDEVGGLDFLNSLVQYRVSAANARRYAELVADKALLRGLIEAADKVRAIALDTSGLTVAQRLDQAQEQLQSVQIHGGRTMPESIDASVVRLLDRIQRVADGDEPQGIPTGIPGLDRMIGGGFKGGKQIILAARPSIGKSSLAQQFCLHLALSEGVPAAFLSQEMSKDELTDRAIAHLGHIELDNVISGRLAEQEWSRLTEAVERLRRCPLFLDDQPALTLHDIAAKARMLKRQHGVKLLVVDYIQLCAGGADDDNRHHQIEQLSRGLKSLARKLDLTVIALSQLNREVEKRASGRPVLSDLKESGAIEEDADIVMLLSRGATSPEGFQIINCDIPKNRQGKVGALTLGFNGAHQRWHETAAPIEFKRPAKRHYTEDV